jgi:hypothetical protein
LPTGSACDPRRYHFGNIATVMNLCKGLMYVPRHNLNVLFCVYKHLAKLLGASPIVRMCRFVKPIRILQTLQPRMLLAKMHQRLLYADDMMGIVPYLLNVTPGLLDKSWGKLDTT